jgi:hypothetical protein
MAWSWRGNIRRFLKVTRTYSIFRARYQSCTQCTVRWPGAGAGGYSTNAVEYGTDLYCIIYLMSDTILHLGIWLSRISRLSRTVPVLYVTQNKKTTTDITMGRAPVPLGLGETCCDNGTIDGELTVADRKNAFARTANQRS